MINRILLSIGLLILVALIAGPVFAGDGTAVNDSGQSIPPRIHINISPTQGQAGTVITLSGSGAEPSRAVFIALSAQANSSANALTTMEVAPAADGTFTASLTVPAGTPDNQYYVRAEQFTPSGRAWQYYWNTFTVSAVTSQAILPLTGADLGSSIVTVMLSILLALAMIGRGIYSVSVSNK